MRDTVRVKVAVMFITDNNIPLLYISNSDFINIFLQPLFGFKYSYSHPNIYDIMLLNTTNMVRVCVYFCSD